MNISDFITSRAAERAQTEPQRIARLASRLDTQHSRFDQVLQDENAAPPTAPAGATPASTPAATQTSPAPAACTTDIFALVKAAQESAHGSSPSAPKVAAPETPVDDHPTVESVFGPSPWLQSVGGYSSGGGSYSYNPIYFATRETADKVAQMLGGTVVAKNAMVGDTGPFFQEQPNYMVQMPDGHLVNAGLVASEFTHGWSQSYIDTLLGYDRNA